MSNVKVIDDPSIIRIYQPIHSQEHNARSFRVCRVVRDAFKGLWFSRLFRPLAFTAVALGAFIAGAAVLAYLGLTPPGWATTAALVTMITVAVLSGFLSGGSGKCNWKTIQQECGIEFGAVYRMFFFKYNEIVWADKKALGRIILGPLPNHASCCRNAPHLITQREHLSAVLSINTPGSIAREGERGPYGLLHPARPTDWQELDIAYAEIDQPDHKPLSLEQLDAAADFIHRVVSQPGGNIYVHCKAGQGRSAMAIAAYLIKHEGKSAEEAVAIIMASRPSATVNTPDKVAALREYDNQQNPEAAFLRLCAQKWPQEIELPSVPKNVLDLH